LILPWLIEELSRANPELQALAAERQAAWQRVPQARAYDDPSFGVQLWRFPLGNGFTDDSMVMYQWTQPLPFPGKRRLRGAAAEAVAEVIFASAVSAKIRLPIV
jgi:hypothetical protein